MPLRDHFRPPLSLRKSWESFLGSWTVVTVTRLNRNMLPARFECETRIHRGTHVDITPSADDDTPDTPHLVPTNPIPPAPPLAAEVVMADADTFEIDVYKQEGGLKLVAVIELVSPANKDRSSHRRAFATKVASYLQQGVSVITVDVVTERSANLHEDISTALHLPDARLVVAQWVERGMLPIASRRR